MTSKKSQTLTDGTRVFNLSGESPKGFAGVLWLAIADDGEELVLTAEQIEALEALEPVEPDTPIEPEVPVQRTQEEREEEFLVYAASGIDTITAAVVTADETPVVVGNSLFDQASHATGVCTGNAIAILGIMLGGYIGIYLYAKMLGF